MKEITGMAQEVFTSSDQRLSHLVVGWTLMIPLFYFASSGSLFFNSNKSVLGSYASAVASGGSRGEDHVIIASVFTITLVLICSRIKSVIGLFSRGTGREFVVLAGLALASCLWSQVPKTTLVDSLYFAINVLFAFYFYQRFNHRQVLKLLLAFGWICLVSSILLALFLPKYGISQAPLGWRGIYDHKNGCAEMTIFLLPGAFFAPVGGLLSRLSRIAYVLLSVILIVMSRSMGGCLLLAFLLAYVIVLRVVQRFPRKDSVVLVLLLLVGGVLPLVLVAISYFKEIAYALGKDPTLTGRTTIWSAVVVSAMKRPLLGYGYMAFWTGLQGESGNVLMANGWSFDHAHNGFLEVWLGIGALGLGVILYSLIKTFRNALPCILARNFYLSWCVSIVLLVAIHAMDESSLATPNSLSWILYIVASIGLADGARRNRFREGRFLVREDHG
jgi:exopolysaccharide production protein ExoQ